MGFFKKIFKGIGKVFKKIGKGIKRAFKKFGKFMGKLGIVGQLAMMFILPGIGGALLKGFGAMAGKMAGFTSKFGGLAGKALTTVVKGAGTVLKGAHSFVQTGVNAFKTVTNGIMEFGKTALNKLPGINIQSATPDFFGEEGVFNKISTDAKRIFDPFKSSITATKDMTLKSLSKTTGLSEGQLQRLNGATDLTQMKQGMKINLDFNKMPVDKTIPGYTLGSGLPAVNPSDVNYESLNKSVSPDMVQNFDASSIPEAPFKTDTPFSVDAAAGTSIEAQSLPNYNLERGFGTEAPFKTDASSLLGAAPESLVGTDKESLLLGSDFSPEKGFTTDVDLSGATSSIGDSTKEFFRDKVFKLEPGETFGQGFKRQTGEAIGSQIRSVATQSILGGGQEAPPEEFVGSYGQPVDAGTVQITAATPMNDVYNQAYNAPAFGGGAYLNQSLDIFNMNLGAGTYRQFAPRAGGMA